jgi:hypothetical protein
MKFYIEKIVLWLKNGTKRTIIFQPNKVNVITGDSNTGKTAILEIVDYCFFASKSKISESVINENIDWYGIKIHINDKVYTIARSALINGKVTDNYYFSSTGELPDTIISNNNAQSIKKIIETEFSIDNNVTIPFGGSSLKAGSKISLRYFLLFNTISGNIIENDSNIFFDKQNEARYREALPRIFDIALGIETIENILKKEKKVELEKELNKLNRKQSRINAGSDDFESEKKDIIKQAKEYALINADLPVKDSMKKLNDIIKDLNSENSDGTEKNEREKLEKEINLLKRKIRNLEGFSSEYTTYKSNLKNTEDSLKPISYLKGKDEELLKTSIFDAVITELDTQLKSIKDSTKSKTPIDNQINDHVAIFKLKIKELEAKLSILPKEKRMFENEKDKVFFLGTIKAKIELYAKSSDTILDNLEKRIIDIEEKIKNISINDTGETKDLTIKLIEEIISEYIEQADTALENYANYKPVFDYKEKSLKLRKPKSSFIEHIGSSSNHMFLHLFFSLAIHETSLKNKSNFIAPFLIIDQPSRPYYGGEDDKKSEIDHSDESKITKAFALLDKYISDRVGDSEEFQMIVFEHIPKTIFKDFGNVLLVEEFRNGNALIVNEKIT